MAEDDITIELEPEITPLPEGGTAPEKKNDTPDPIAELKAQYDAIQVEKDSERNRADAERRNAAAERQRAEAAERELETTRTEVVESRQATIDSGISQAQTASDAAEAEITAAMEGGDWKRLAKAQVQLADARSRLTRLDEAKADLEVAKTQPREPRQTPAAPALPADPTEAFIASRTAPTAAWLRDHRDYLSDDRKSAKLTAAHHDAKSEGLREDTPEYFAHVEKFLGIGKQVAAGHANGAGNGGMQPARKSTPPVAPVSASAGGTNGGGPVVTLRPFEVTAANDGTHVWGKHDLAAGRIKDASQVGRPIGNQEFARRKAALTAQGAYDRVYVEQ